MYKTTTGFWEAARLWPNIAPLEVRRIFWWLQWEDISPTESISGKPAPWHHLFVASCFWCSLYYTIKLLQLSLRVAIYLLGFNTPLENTKGYFTGCHSVLPHCIHYCNSCCQFRARMRPLWFLFSFTKRQSTSLQRTDVTLANTEHVCLELHTGLKIPGT